MVGSDSEGDRLRRDERDRLQRLLVRLRRAGLERPGRRPTFMEVAGIERREVAVSGYSHQMCALVAHTNACVLRIACTKPE